MERLRAAIVELEGLVSDEDSDEDSPEPTTTPEGQKRLQAMRDEIELAEKVGVAKARLAAVQHMGAEATKEERAEAEQLATDLYNLKESAGRSEEGDRGGWKGGRRGCTEEARRSEVRQGGASSANRTAIPDHTGSRCTARPESRAYAQRLRR